MLVFNINFFFRLYYLRINTVVNRNLIFFIILLYLSVYLNSIFFLSSLNSRFIIFV
jgi:hypothetical protein